MDTRIVEFVKKHHSREDFSYHILPVVKNALLLGKKLNADLEVLEIAAYMHDIGEGCREDNYAPENDHHITGAQEAKKLLTGWEFDEKLIGKVEHCILTHRGRKGPAPETTEAKIISCADAMAHFDTFLNLFDFYLKMCGSFEEALATIKVKMQRDWEKKITIPEARKIAKPKYEAVMLLIESQERCVEGSK